MICEKTEHSARKIVAAIGLGFLQRCLYGDCELVLYPFDEELQNIVHYLLAVKLKDKLVPRLAVNADIHVAAVLHILHAGGAHSLPVFPDRVHAAAQEQYGGIGGCVFYHGSAVAA